jgi:hypothetical protein
MVLLQTPNPSSSQSNANPHADNKRTTEQDQIHACHCMSLPIASQNTQYYLQAGYGLARAVASAEMALFAEALSVRFDHLEALSVPRRCLCGSIIWRRCLFGSIVCAVQSFGGVFCSEALSVPCDHSEALLYYCGFPFIMTILGESYQKLNENEKTFSSSCGFYLVISKNDKSILKKTKVGESWAKDKTFVATWKKTKVCNKSPPFSLHVCPC